MVRIQPLFTGSVRFGFHQSMDKRMLLAEREEQRPRQQQSQRSDFDRRSLFRRGGVGAGLLALAPLIKPAEVLADNTTPKTPRDPELVRLVESSKIDLPKWYQDQHFYPFMARWKEVEEMPLTVETTVQRTAIINGYYQTYYEKVRGTNTDRQNKVTALERDIWNSLLSKVKAKESPRREALQMLGLWQVYRELTQPSEKLVRFDYYGYDDLVKDLNSGKISRSKFKSTMQKRALNALYGFFYTDQIKQGDMFYEAIMKVLQENRDPDVQKEAFDTLRWGMDTFSDKYREPVATKVLDVYLQSKPGKAKYSAMCAVSSTYYDLNKNQGAQVKLRNKLRVALAEAFKRNDIVGAKYHMVCLALLKDASLIKALTDIVNDPNKYKAHTDEYEYDHVQRAVTWALGRFSTRKDVIDLLEKALANKAFSPVAREIAVYSLTELHPKDPKRVRTLLEHYADKANKAEQDVQDAARHMLIKLNTYDDSKTVADFYINRFFKKDDAKRRDYISLRNRYIYDIDKLSVQQKNFIDRTLLMFYPGPLKAVVDSGGHARFATSYLTDEEEARHSTGHRYSDGRFYDNMGGFTAPSTNTMISKRASIYSEHGNTFGHEFFHHMHFSYLPHGRENPKILELYREGANARCSYGRRNKFEYTAMAGESFVDLWRNHWSLRSLAFMDGYFGSSGQPRTHVRRHDPNMYKFIRDNIRVNTPYAIQA